MWRLAQRSVGLNGRTLRKLPLLAHAFHMDTNKYPTSIPIRGGDKENVSVGQLAVVGKGDKRSSVPSVPLDVFVEALLKAVDSRFADQHRITQSTNESATGGREKTSTTAAVVPTLCDVLNTTSSVDMNLP